MTNTLRNKALLLVAGLLFLGTRLCAETVASIWGTSTDYTVWYRSGVTPTNPKGTHWTKVDGKMKYVSCSVNGVVWAIEGRKNPNDPNKTVPGKIFYREGITKENPTGTSWTLIPGNPDTKLGDLADQLDVGNGQVWVSQHIDRNINIAQHYFRVGIDANMPKGTIWQKVAGTKGPGAVGRIFGGYKHYYQDVDGLFHFTVGPNNEVYGVYGNVQFTVVRPTGWYKDYTVDLPNNIFQWNNATQAWGNIPGQLKQLDVGKDGMVWGTNFQNDVNVMINPSVSSEWKPISGVKIKHVSCGPTGEVWACGVDNLIYWRAGRTAANPFGESWERIHGALQQIDVGSIEYVEKPAEAGIAADLLQTGLKFALWSNTYKKYLRIEAGTLSATGKDVSDADCLFKIIKVGPSIIRISSDAASGNYLQSADASPAAFSSQSLDDTGQWIVEFQDQKNPDFNNVYIRNKATGGFLHNLDLNSKAATMLTDGTQASSTLPGTSFSIDFIPELPEGFLAENGVYSRVTVGSHDGTLSLLVLTKDKKTLKTYNKFSLAENPWEEFSNRIGAGGTISTFKDISVASDGTLWAINENGKVYQYDWTQKSFKSVDAPRSSGANIDFDIIAAGSNDSIWTVDLKERNLYYFKEGKKGGKGTWELINSSKGSVIYVAAGLDDAVVAVNDKGETKYNIQDEKNIDKWLSMKGGTSGFVKVAIGNRDNILGIKDDGSLWQFIDVTPKPVEAPKTDDATKAADTTKTAEKVVPKVETLTTEQWLARCEWKPVVSTTSKSVLGIKDVAVNAAGTTFVLDGNGNIIRKGDAGFVITKTVETVTAAKTVTKTGEVVTKTRRGAKRTHGKVETTPEGVTTRLQAIEEGKVAIKVKKQAAKKKKLAPARKQPVKAGKKVAKKAAKKKTAGTVKKTPIKKTVKKGAKAPATQVRLASQVGLTKPVAAPKPITPPVPTPMPTPVPMTTTAVTPTPAPEPAPMVSTPAPIPGATAVAPATTTPAGPTIIKKKKYSAEELAKMATEEVEVPA